jgi:hypothetical protein
MSDATAPVNDYGYDFDITVTDSVGNAANCSGYTVLFKVWKPGVSGTLIVNGVCNAVNADAGTFTYTVNSADFTNIADLKCELERVKTGVRESTENLDLKVEESG